MTLLYYLKPHQFFDAGGIEPPEGDANKKKKKLKEVKAKFSKYERAEREFKGLLKNTPLNQQEKFIISQKWKQALRRRRQLAKELIELEEDEIAAIIFLLSD